MSSEYPESEKLALASETRKVVSDFLEWLGDQDLEIGEYRRLPDFRDEVFVPISVSSSSLVMKFLGIDTVKLEAERRAMFRALQGLS